MDSYLILIAGTGLLQAQVESHVAAAMMQNPFRTALGCPRNSRQALRTSVQRSLRGKASATWRVLRLSVADGCSER